MVFKPSLNDGSPDSFLDLIEGLLDDVYKMSSLVPRIAPQVGFPDYQVNFSTLKIFFVFMSCASVSFRASYLSSHV